MVSLINIVSETTPIPLTMHVRSLIAIVFAMLLSNFLHAQPDSTSNTQNAILLLGSNPDNLKKAIQKSIAENPSNIRNYLILGSLFEEQLKYDSAQAVYQKTIHLDSTCSKCFQQLAGVMVTKGMIKQAISHYNQAILLDSANTSARINLARLLKRENRFKESVEHWTYLLLNDTSNFYIWEQIGDCAMNLNDKGWAWNAYFNSFFLNPQNLQIASKIGQIGIQQKVPYEYFEFVVDSALTFDSLYIPLLRIKGTMHFNVKNYKESITWYSKAISMGDSSRATHKQMGISLHMRKQFSESITYLEKVYQADSTDLIVNYFLAKSLNSTGVANRAIEILNISEKLMFPLPDELSTLYEELSISYQLIDDYENAIFNLQKAFTANPSKIELLITMAFLHEEITGDKKSALECFNKFISEIEKLKVLNVDISKYEWEIERANMGVKRLTEELFFKDEL